MCWKFTEMKFSMSYCKLWCICAKNEPNVAKDKANVGFFPFCCFATRITKTISTRIHNVMEIQSRWLFTTRKKLTKQNDTKQKAHSVNEPILFHSFPCCWIMECIILTTVARCPVGTWLSENKLLYKVIQYILHSEFTE